MFRREPEWLHGEGIGTSRAPLVMMQFVLRALRHARRLSKTPLGVLIYSDEGRDARFSGETIGRAMAEARNVLVLRPGLPGDKFVAGRRGQRCYRLFVEGTPMWPGKRSSRPEVLRWLFQKLEACSKLTSRSDRIAVSTIDLKPSHLPMLLPHQATATMLVSFPDDSAADKTESEIRNILDGKGVKWKLEQVSDRPPMKEGRSTKRLVRELGEIAKQWELPVTRETSVWPSVAGLAPAKTGAVCGLGPVATDLYTPVEGVQRISLMHRTLLLAQFLCTQGK